MNTNFAGNKVLNRLTAATTGHALMAACRELKETDSGCVLTARWARLSPLEADGAHFGEDVPCSRVFERSGTSVLRMSSSDQAFIVAYSDFWLKVAVTAGIPDALHTRKMRFTVWMNCKAVKMFPGGLVVVHCPRDPKKPRVAGTGPQLEAVTAEGGGGTPPTPDVARSAPRTSRLAAALEGFEERLKKLRAAGSAL